jgi:hypothetical protein
MKRISLVAALLGAIALAVSGIAMAGTGANYGSSGSAGNNGKGTAVTHYSVNYSDYFFGNVACTGVNQVKAKQPTQDSFTCTSQNGPFQNVAPGQALTLSTFGGWNSDAPGMNAQPGTSFTGTVSADGMSYTAVATY